MAYVTKEQLNKLIGSPLALMNVSDFIVIGLMSIIFLYMVHILGMSWHRFSLLRWTGSASTSLSSPRTFGAGQVGNPNEAVGMDQ